MKQTRILVIEDDQPIRKFIRANLEARGFEVLTAVDGEEGLKLTELELPDLILLDIMMPRIDGFEVCHRIREWSKIPIIMLSARADEMDKVKCLDYGADDYMTKPFSLKELLSRVNAVLRRTQDTSLLSPNTRFKYGDLEVDFTSHTAKLGGKILNLTSIEDKMLRYLAINSGRIVTSNQLLEQVWGGEYFGDYRVLQVNICRLRKKLGDNPKSPKFIRTKPGIGYYLGKYD
jgi:DNA-binding response OmpR family regulator